jgi:hypothetical protein
LTETKSKNWGYEKLKAAIERDCEKRGVRNDSEYWDKFDWILKRAEHYAEKTGIPKEEILNSWEEGRDYWYMNYYQESNQPEIKGDKVRVFDTVQDMLDAIEKKRFRCPACEQVSTSPYICNSGHINDKGKMCDWKVYGLFGDLGKGTYVFVKEKVAGETIFMPLSWEDTANGEREETAI